MPGGIAGQMWRITTALRERRGSKAPPAADQATDEPLRTQNNNGVNSSGDNGGGCATRPPDERDAEYVPNHTTRTVSMSQVSPRTDDSDTPRSSESVGRGGAGTLPSSPRPNHTVVVAPLKRPKTRSPPPFVAMPTLDVICHTRSDDDNDVDGCNDNDTPRSPHPAAPDGARSPRPALAATNGTNDGSRSPRMGMTFIRRLGARSPRPDYVTHDSNSELTSDSLGDTPKQSPRATSPHVRAASPHVNTTTSSHVNATPSHARPCSPPNHARTPSDPWSGTREQITERVESVEFHPSISLAVLAAAKAYAMASASVANNTASATAADAATVDAAAAAAPTPRDGRSATAPFPCGVAAWRWATPFGTDDYSDHTQRGCQRCAMKRHGYTTLYGAPCTQCASDLAFSVSLSPSPSIVWDTSGDSLSSSTLFVGGSSPSVLVSDTAPSTMACGSSPLASGDDTTLPLPASAGGSWIRAQRHRTSLSYVPTVATLDPSEV